jgi:hypothetical protein
VQCDEETCVELEGYLNLLSKPDQHAVHTQAIRGVRIVSREFQTSAMCSGISHQSTQAAKGVGVDFRGFSSLSLTLNEQCVHVKMEDSCCQKLQSTRTPSNSFLTELVRSAVLRLRVKPLYRLRWIICLLGNYSGY